MSLTLSAQPGFTDLPDATFDAGATPSTSTLKALNADVKFGAVRNEQFWGYYKHGETVALPTSPADGYDYSRDELLYTWSFYSNAPPSGATNGSQTAPGTLGNSGPGTVLGITQSVDQATGAVSCVASYYNGAQTNTHDGVVMVMVHAQRDR